MVKYVVCQVEIILFLAGSLSLGFLICEVGLITVPHPAGGSEG